MKRAHNFAIPHSSSEHTLIKSIYLLPVETTMKLNLSLAILIKLGTSADAFTVNNAFQSGVAFQRSGVKRAEAAFSRPSCTPLFAIRSLEQELHTAERVAGMSRGEIQHIFEDVDTDSSGAIDLVEL